MLPDLESLRCFHAAAQHLNFREAARVVSLSPAAFGDRIKRLEELLETRLFERTTRKVMLTPGGERLWPHARLLLEQATRCAEIAQGTEGESPFALSIGTRFELGLSWVTPAIGELEAQRPERQLHLYFGDTAALLHALRRTDVDCLITSARVTGPGLIYARLHEERYAFVAAPGVVTDNPLRRPDDARHHRLLELNATLPLFRYFLDARPGDEIWSFERTQYLGTIGPVRERALAGAGVAVLPHYFVKDDLAAGRLEAIMPKVKMPVDWFRLIWHETHPRQAALHEIAGELAKLPLK